jgi:hypothetical protein
MGAFAGNGNGAPTGAHYNLNIIGVENPKNATMTGSNRHTIFVPLKSTKTGNKSVKTNDDGTVGPGTAIVDSKIWLAPGETFRVCDGNGFDAAYGCSESFDDDWNRCEFNENDEYVCLVTKKRGAVFELPCNNNVVSDGAEEFIACDPDDPQASYSVWARALGKPGGNATATTCATVDKDLVCSLEQAVLTRDYGKSSFTDVTQELTSLYAYLCDVALTELDDGSLICDIDGDLVADPDGVTLTRISLFAGDTEDWFWNYDNNGLRLAQLRFYPE